MKFLVNTIIDSVQAVKHSYEGLGVVIIDDYQIFVDNLLPYERAKIIVKKCNSNFGFARVIERYNSSPLRVDINNPKLMQSGTTSLANISYTNQLKFKQNWVFKLFERNLNYINVLKILPSEQTWRYRNKFSVFCKMIENSLKTGLYEKNTHNLIEQDSYELVTETMEKILLWLNKNLGNYKCFVKNYNLIENITLRESSLNSNAFLIFEVSESFDLSTRFIKDLMHLFPNIINIFMAKNQNIIYQYNKNNITLTDKIGPFKFKFGWNSFFQINSFQTHNLYSLLLDNLNLDADKIVIDAYSGIGTISLFLAQKAKKVYGLEVNAEAVENAKENALINNIKNTEFLAGDVTKTINKIKDTIDIVVVDPPRAGMSTKFLSKLVALKPKEIGYISCNPHTLCRDCVLLKEYGYELVYLKPCDMFCQTHHIECVAILKLIK